MTSKPGHVDELRAALDRFDREKLAAYHRLADEAKPVAGESLVAFRPIYSDALAVHPVDVAEAEADSKRKGVPTEFLPDGRCVLRTRAHRKAYLKAYKFHDRQGGYGD